jgi:hypothetical protein
MLIWVIAAATFHLLAPLMSVPAARVVGARAPAKRLLAVGYPVYWASVALYLLLVILMGPFVAWERAVLLAVIAFAFALTVRRVGRTGWLRSTVGGALGVLLLFPLLAVHIVFLQRFPTAVGLELAVRALPDSRSARRAYLHYKLLGDRLFTAPVQKAAWCASSSCCRDWVRLKMAKDDLEDIGKAIEQFWQRNQRPPTEAEIRSLKIADLSGSRRTVPRSDPWGEPYDIEVRPRGRYPQNGSVRVASSGADRRFEESTEGLRCELRVDRRQDLRSASLDADLVFSPGCNFLQIFDYPKELQAFLYTRAP